MRTLVIGDIHGGLRGLNQVLERTGLQDSDKLIFLGDYVDGWSESFQTIEHLLAVARNYECIFIKGNHDIWCEEWLNAGIVNEVWYDHGGKSTIESYSRLKDSRRAEHVNFFRQMRHYHIDEENNLFIHAGFSSMHGPQKETYSSNYSWDRTLWEMALTVDQRIEKSSLLYPKRLLIFKEIYIGHTPTTNYGVDIPMNACNVWNIDTGAAFTGKLSCLDIQTKQFWQSDPLRNLYQNEKGRN